MRLADRSISRPRWTALTAAALLAATAVLTGVASAAAPVVTPATQPAATRDDTAINADLKRVSTELNKTMAGNSLADPAKRSVAAPTAIPLIKQEVALLHEYGAAHHSEKMLANIEQRFDAELYLLGDKETIDRIDAAASGSSADSVDAQGEKLFARWIGAGRDAEAQKAVAADLEKLDVAHTDSDFLTTLTVTFANSAAAPDLRTHLRDVATKTMTSPLAARMAASMKSQAASEAKLNSLANKPLVLNGTTVDGKPFSVEEYKGKVVLVDFWATWCGPCKAELPRVKEMYSKYHDQGLEIVGVSNDFSVDALKKFTPENGMPWVELIDAKAAAEHHWNPTTLGYGINGIPTMFLVDKKGILRTVTARAEMETLIPKLLAE